jgi:hypothetical protein
VKDLMVKTFHFDGIIDIEECEEFNAEGKPFEAYYRFLKPSEAESIKTKFD